MRSSPRAHATLAGVAIAALAAVAVTAARASVFDFDVWMRAIDKRSVDVQKNIAAGKTADATADAQELARLYGLMTDYFVADGHSPDAVEMSRAGKAQADAIPPALAAHDVEAAASSALALARSCNDCHDAHKPFQ